MLLGVKTGSIEDKLCVKESNYLEQWESLKANLTRQSLTSPHPAASGSIPSVPKIIDVAEVNKRRWFEESGQWLENVDRTHLDLVSAKPVG